MRRKLNLNMVTCGGQATIPIVAARRRMVGGQKDMIVDVALDLLKAREAFAAASAGMQA